MIGPPAGSTTGQGSSAPEKRERYVVRRGRIGDLRTLADLYLNQSETSRATYHPFPFRRRTLYAIYGWMIVAQRLVRVMIRLWPARAAVLLVATRDGGSAPVGYGTVRFTGVRSDLSAKYGYMVGEGFRGQGIGTLLVKEMIATALALGITKGGGSVLATNPASIAVIRKFGFGLQAAGASDRGAPQEENFVVTTGTSHEVRAARRPTSDER